MLFIKEIFMKINNAFKNKDIKLKPNLFDLVIIFICIISTTLVFIFSNISFNKKQDGTEERIVQVYYESKIIYEVNLDNISSNYELILEHKDYPLIKDHMVISFSKEKGVAVIESSCQNKNCVNEGYINDSNRVIACLPSGINIIITSSSSNERWM